MCALCSFADFCSLRGKVIKKLKKYVLGSIFQHKCIQTYVLSSYIQLLFIEGFLCARHSTLVNLCNPHNNATNQDLVPDISEEKLKSSASC